MRGMFISRRELAEWVNRNSGFVGEVRRPEHGAHYGARRGTLHRRLLVHMEVARALRRDTQRLCAHLRPLLRRYLGVLREQGQDRRVPGDDGAHLPLRGTVTASCPRPLTPPPSYPAGLAAAAAACVAGALFIRRRKSIGTKQEETENA